MCVCVCVCVSVRERERERERDVKCVQCRLFEDKEIKDKLTMVTAQRSVFLFGQGPCFSQLPIDNFLDL